MKKIIFLFMLSAIVIFGNGCKHIHLSEAIRLTSDEVDAVGPYLSRDNHGQPVLCWTEKNREDSLYYLKYALYDIKSNTFKDPVIIPGSAGASLSAENMGKVAFKEDGSVLAVFAKTFNDEKNKYAGGIYYCISEDGGSHWSEPRFIHSDTSHSYGRSFFDIARLANGEIGAIWLDGRFGKEQKGSALFFARTEKGKGFGMDSCLDKSTCECCRTEILTDNKGRIHIAYRGIQFPSGEFGKQVRDMVYITSGDDGRTFSDPNVISNDHWEIEGCPHTGPTLAATQSVVNAVWFTGGGVPGLYSSYLKNEESDFKNRMLMSKSGRHPQMINVKEKLAIVWEESVNSKEDRLNRHREPNQHDMKMNHENMDMHSSSATTSQVILTIADQEGNVNRTIPISNENDAADHAVIAKTDKGVLIAWVQDEKDHSGIYYSFRVID